MCSWLRGGQVFLHHRTLSNDDDFLALDHFFCQAEILSCRTTDADTQILHPHG